MAWYAKFDGVDGSIDSTAPVLQPELTTEPTAPEAWEPKPVKITSYQTGAQSEGDDTFDFQPELTTEPTASEDGKVYSKPLTFTVTVSAPEADGTDDLAVDPTNPNTGDDAQPDVLVGADGSDTFNFQPELTSEPTAPEAGKVSRYGDDRLMSDVISFEIDPTNPNDLLATPGPDDNVGLPAADGLLLPY